ncbi:type II toxin-antitoxin system RelB/DinJ family antitoxin [Erwinia sp. V71]|uniref:type II toxin-antitoxin system RelB/DinJ family antitoxin n=1 Tax=Erwinia sp. V71 TaxID=3369424 RepID=UPI003F63F3E4
MNAEVRSRIDSDLKERAASILADCGLNWSTAIRMFAEQIVKTEGLPFEVTRKPSARLLNAMQEADDIINQREGRFRDADELMDSLNDGKR